MLSTVKKALRISEATTAFDDEVNDCINAAVADLKRMGVQQDCLPTTSGSCTDPLVRRAIILFAKSWFDFEGEGERYGKAYDKSAAAITMDKDRNGLKEAGS